MTMHAPLVQSGCAAIEAASGAAPFAAPRAAPDLAYLEDVADRAVLALNARADRTLWSYRAPVLARDLARNGWVSILSVADLGVFLPERQLYLRIDATGAIDAGYMETSNGSDAAIAAIAALRARVPGGVCGPAGHAGHAIRVVPCTPLLGQVQERCDLETWMQTVAAIKTGQVHCVAACATFRTDAGCAEDLSDAIIATLVPLADLARADADQPTAATRLDCATIRAAATDAQARGFLRDRLQSRANSVHPDAIAVTQCDSATAIRLVARQGNDDVVAELTLSEGAPRLTLGVMHRYSVSRFGGRGDVLKMNAARQRSRGILHPLEALGFAIGHRTTLLSETNTVTERAAEIAATLDLAAGESSLEDGIDAVMTALLALSRPA
ncbi:hypothetical protein [Roseivivax sp. CAU 1753]